MGTSLIDLDPELRDALQDFRTFLGRNGLVTTLTSTVRTYREQKFLFDRYTKGISPLPAAPPGHSAHEYGWAFDLLVTPSQYQKAAGNAWQSLWGGTWGGKRDPVHFELPGAGALADRLGKEGAQHPADEKALTLWDYGFWALDATSLVSILFELGYIVYSREEAEKVARALHIDPNGRIF